VTDDDRRLAEELDSIIKNEYGSARDFLREFERETGEKISESALCKGLAGKARLPTPLRSWTKVKVAFGTIYIEDDKNGSKLLRVLKRAAEEKDFAALADSATAFIAAYEAGSLRDEGPELLPRLYAYRAVGYRGLDRVVETIQDYKKAIEFARKLAPRLCPRYEISAIVWDSERINKLFQSGDVSKTYWQKQLHGMIGQLEQIKTIEKNDENMRLQSLLRNTSRTGAREKYEHWLKAARNHPGFGATPEKRDTFLRKWMSEKNDKDGDFKNARSYQSFADLF
jgi:hypothetical protein